MWFGQVIKYLIYIRVSQNLHCAVKDCWNTVARSQILKRSNNRQSFALTVPTTPQDELTFLTRPGTPGADLTPLNFKKEWMTDCIDTHNYYRNLYRDNKAGKRLSVLAWNASLAQSAQNWAQYLISNSKPVIINPSYPYGESAGLNSYGWRDEFTCSPLIDNFTQRLQHTNSASRHGKVIHQPVHSI
jgi:hypothetical protein